MKRILVVSLGLLLLGAMATYGLAAEFDTDTVTVKVGVTAHIDITVDTPIPPTPTIDFGDITGFDDNPAAEDTKFTVKSNKGFDVEAEVTTRFSETDNVFPIEILEIENDADPAVFTPMGTGNTPAAVDLVTGAAKTKREGRQYTKQIQLNIAGWTDDVPTTQAGDYTAVITYTATQS